MPTLPIPQETTPANLRADPLPGVGPVPTPSPIIRKMTRKPAFRTPVFPRKQNQEGMSYEMAIPSDSSLTPTVPVAVRSSLAQIISVFRMQSSRYISISRPGPVPMTYPIAKVVSHINTAPQMNRRNRPVAGSTGHPSRSGFMTAPRRFTKALRAPVNEYQPPIYGG